MIQQKNLINGMGSKDLEQINQKHEELISEILVQEEQLIS